MSWIRLELRQAHNGLCAGSTLRAVKHSSGSTLRLTCLHGPIKHPVLPVLRPTALWGAEAARTLDMLRPHVPFNAALRSSFAGLVHRLGQACGSLLQQQVRLCAAANPCMQPWSRGASSSVWSIQCSKVTMLQRLRNSSSADRLLHRAALPHCGLYGGQHSTGLMRDA